MTFKRQRSCGDPVDQRSFTAVSGHYHSDIHIQGFILAVSKAAKRPADVRAARSVTETALPVGNLTDVMLWMALQDLVAALLGISAGPSIQQIKESILVRRHEPDQPSAIPVLTEKSGSHFGYFGPRFLIASLVPCQGAI